MIAQVYKAIVAALKAYPAVSMMILNILVVVAAHFGFHVTPDQLMSIAVVAAGFVGVIVHNAVTPNSRVPKV
jgi:predicted tellurium resistance membrane protein TerC